MRRVFIELTEALRCPKPHDESYLVCIPVTMDGRRVTRGVLGCPACQAEFPIADGVVWFGGSGGRGVDKARASSLTADAVQTFLDLQGGGGYVLLVGSAGRLGAALAERLERVHVVGVNPPADAAPTAGFSVLRSPDGLPVKRQSMRGVVVGADAASEPWLGASLGTLLPGLRAVVEDESFAFEGLAELARGAGVVVAEKR